jgi:hypothetical protein
MELRRSRHKRGLISNGILIIPKSASHQVKRFFIILSFFDINFIQSKRKGYPIQKNSKKLMNSIDTP